MMLQLFPNRNRRDLKLKFKKEEKTNLGLVNKALLYPKQFNILELKQQFDAEDQEIERQKEEEKKKKEEMEQKVNEHKKVRKKLISVVKAKNPRRNITKSQRALLNGGQNYEDSFHEAQSDEADDVEEIHMPKEKIIELPEKKDNSVTGNFDINNMEIDLIDATPVTDSFYPASEITSSSDNTESTNSLKQSEERINITQHPEQSKTASDDESDMSDSEKLDTNEENVGFPFDIDINSLVLVESQDTENPEKPIFEIYVVDQETGKLGEKPLDLSWEDVEMIRSLMEENEEED